MAESTTPPEAPPEITARARSRALVAVLIGVTAFWFVHRTQWSSAWSSAEASFVHHAFRATGLVPGPALPSTATPAQAATLGYVMYLVGATPETLRGFMLFVLLVLAAATLEGLRRCGIAVAIVVLGWILASREIVEVDFVSPMWIAAALVGVARLASADESEWSAGRAAVGILGAAALASFSPGAAVCLAAVLIVDATTTRAARARITTAVAAAVCGGLAFAIDRDVVSRLRFDPVATTGWHAMPSLPWLPKPFEWVALAVLGCLGAASIVFVPTADRRRAVGRVVCLALIGGCAPFLAPSSRDAIIAPVWLAAIAALVGACASNAPRAIAWGLAILVLGCHVQLVRDPPPPKDRPDAVLVLESARASRLPASGLVVSGDLRVAVAVAARTGHNPGIPVVLVPEDAEPGGLAGVCRQLGLQRVWFVPPPETAPPELIATPSPVRGPPNAAHFVVGPR